MYSPQQVYHLSCCAFLCMHYVVLLFTPLDGYFWSLHSQCAPWLLDVGPTFSLLFSNPKWETGSHPIPTNLLCFSLHSSLILFLIIYLQHLFFSLSSLKKKNSHFHPISIVKLHFQPNTNILLLMLEVHIDYR